MLTKQERLAFVINNIACPLSKPQRGFTKQATRGGSLNFKTSWVDLKHPSKIYFYNKSVIELTNLGYNIRYNKVNHAKQCYTILLYNDKKVIRCDIPLACITDKSKVIKRTRIKTKKAVCYIDESFIDTKIVITTRKTKKIRL